MRYGTIAALVIVPAALSQTPASALPCDNTRWCAQYSGKSGGATNCGFSSFEQCQASVSGIGGFCRPSQLQQSAMCPPDVLRNDDTNSSQNIRFTARLAAGAFGFLIFNHVFDGRDLYGAIQFFVTCPLAELGYGFEHFPAVPPA